ncbi:hypothetical protein JIN84_12820 [Luteolibacter yonseiensis]|uniref:Uncharacterized protein n=1 Tax=Luteolibacter yonseiensis TaxID=1144680 RepID=A0A934VC14_9BACT|nr:hypothetical protein [Luteolibacter yonseiensis]MBK1816501.1 hypothetical protein [Luteolibacter yonseiensis]
MKRADTPKGAALVALLTVAACVLAPWVVYGFARILSEIYTVLHQP